jgi:hypothetical protein
MQSDELRKSSCLEMNLGSRRSSLTAAGRFLHTPSMSKWLQILTAVTLVVPLGLLDCSMRLKEGSSSSCVLEDSAEKDVDSSEQHENKHPCQLFEVLRPPGFYPAFCPAGPATNVALADRGCIEMHGCRPPPVSACC